jgi:D-serine deaminase-like pyridoxal phosphate-dependent protein
VTARGAALEPALATAIERAVARDWRPLTLPEPVPVDTLPTPALLLDADAFERNLARMAQFLAANGKGMRPHAKTHKCPLIAHRQIEAGAVGICAAKVSEAAVLVNAGIQHVLVTSPIVDAARARLLVDLARKCDALDVVVDSERGLGLLQDAVSTDDTLGIVIDVDVAMGRTGTRDIDTVLRLAGAANTSRGLRFRGVQHYAGHVMHIGGHAARREKSLALWDALQAIVDALAARGLAPAIVSGGGTGTYDIDVAVPYITDLQVGSFIFMDHQYRDIGGVRSAEFNDFEVALFVVATAISQPRAGLITVDAGYKAFAVDAGAPRALDRSGCEYRFAGDEHGVLLSKEPGVLPVLGERVRFAAPHCDPTVNLYDWYWVCRGGMARELWPIAARGCSW